MLEPITLPEDLSELSDEDLATLAGEVEARSAALTTDDGADELIESLGDQAAPLLENALAADEAVNAEVTRRDEAKAEQAQILADLREKLAARREEAATEDDEETDPEAVEDPEDDPEAVVDPDDEDEDAEKVEDEDAVVAGGTATKLKAAPKKTRAPRRSKDQEPVSSNRDGRPEILSLVDLPGEFAMGTPITREQMSKLVSERWNKLHRGSDGTVVDVPLVRLKATTPEARMLHEGQDQANWNKIQDVVGEGALTASGGICAPPENYYDFQLLSTEETPIVNSLPRFGAERGGMQWMTPPTLADISTAVGIKTAANDAVGGTTATKTSQVLPCPGRNTAFIDAIYEQVTIGNFTARTWPELVDHFMSLTGAAHARLRETKILDAFKAGSTAVTGAQYNGAINTLLPELNVMTDALRSRHRMASNARFRAWFPRWLLGLLVTDLQRGQFDRFSRDRAGVEALIRDAGVEPVWYFDSATSDGQVFGTQGAGAAQVYPSTMKWVLAPEGTWIRLDGGELDLGIVRDSTLNATNDFSSFAEVFETTAKIGIESLYITTTLCANGVVSAPAAPSGC